METGGRLQQWEMAQTTPDMLFGPLVSVFLFPFILNDTNAYNSMFVKYTAFYLDTMQYGNRWKTTTMGNGPNDTRHVVWALVGVFLLFSLHISMLIYVLLHIQILINILCDMETGGRL